MESGEVDLSPGSSAEGRKLSMATDFNSMTESFCAFEQNGKIKMSNKSDLQLRMLFHSSP